jgi:hypothetical protein
MPNQDFNSLRARRIADAQKNIEDAIREREVAEGHVRDARARVDVAQDNADKEAAQGDLEYAEGQLADAHKRVEFEKAQRDSVLKEPGEGASPRMVAVQYGVFSGLGLVVLIFLMYGIASQRLLPSLASLSTSRGLITFLIAVVTVTIALILAIATVVSDSQDRAARFAQGKEVLTALIGVLGTIVGFYFGQSNGGAKALEIARPYLSQEVAEANDTVRLVTFVSGGKPPYSYEITFTPSGLFPGGAIKGQSPNGLINVDVKIPPVKTDTDLSFVIEANDSGGQPALYNSSDEGQKVLLKAPRTDAPRKAGRED